MDSELQRSRKRYRDEPTEIHIRKFVELSRRVFPGETLSNTFNVTWTEPKRSLNCTGSFDPEKDEHVLELQLEKGVLNGKQEQNRIFFTAMKFMCFSKRSYYKDKALSRAVFIDLDKRKLQMKLSDFEDVVPYLLKGWLVGKFKFCNKYQKVTVKMVSNA